MPLYEACLSFLRALFAPAQELQPLYIPVETRRIKVPRDYLNE